jgi:hypothetical protein
MSSERAAAINPLLLTNTMMGQTPFADPVKMDRQDAFSIPAFDALQKFADRFELRTVLYFTLGVHIVSSLAKAFSFGSLGGWNAPGSYYLSSETP